MTWPSKSEVKNWRISSTCQLLLLHRAEGVREVRGDQTLLGRRPLGTACTSLEDLDSFVHIAEEADLLLYILVVIRVEEVVDGEAFEISSYVEMGMVTRALTLSGFV